MKIGLGIGLGYSKESGGGAVAPVNTIAPVISGTAVVGQVLTSTTGTWTGTPTPTYSYQWKRGATNIGTNSNTYTLVAADAGESITCVVTATNTAGSANATSNALTILATLIDVYPNAAAAYSVRLLRGAYYGSPAIRVRRSNDNAEQNIGFTTSGNLDTSALTTFVGANSGFVTTWYDQSGNARNATQTTAANQPQIVSSGSVINVNGKASLRLDGTNDDFSLSSTITTSIYSNFVVLKKTTTGSIVIPSGLTNGQLTGAWSDGNLYENNGTSFVSVPYTNNTNQNLFSVIKNGNTLSDFSATQNASTLGSYTGSPFTSITTDRLGARTGTFSDGNMQEIVLYSSNQSSNRTGILTNINTYYGIY